MNTKIHLIKLISQSTATAQTYFQYLSADERQRAAKFATPLLQERFTLTRGWLRQTLANQLNAQPKDLIFTYAKQGKPALKNHPSLAFNLAHSGDYAVIAITENDPIGIDIEKEDRMQDCVAIAKRFFTSTEYKAILASQQPEILFCHIWTQKEAFLKATGKGLSFGLDQFEVSTNLSTTQVYNIQNLKLAKENWQSQSLTIVPGYRIVVTKLNSLGIIDFIKDHITTQ